MPTQKPTIAPGPFGSCQAGDRCPRLHCGGLLVRRTCVTHVGTCEEVVCTSCARAQVTKVIEPYAPMLHSPQAIEEACAPDPAGRDTARTSDSGEVWSLPASVGHAIGLNDEDLPDAPTS